MYFQKKKKKYVKQIYHIENEEIRENISNNAPGFMQRAT